jgi:DNA-binding TFAR19-related protein (PDSD5 family)
MTMKHYISVLFMLGIQGALLGSSFPLPQQPIVEPRDSTQIVINGKRISISYGRPSMRGRRIMGDFVRYNSVWRTGSGRSTTLTTDAGLELGGMEIPVGSYSLWTLPSEREWKLIINKQAGQWGTVYNPQQDLARITLQKKNLASPVEKLTITLERTSNLSGVLKIEWEHTLLSVPFKVSPIPIIAIPSTPQPRRIEAGRLAGNFINVSPRDSVEITIDGKKISINYGRPSARGRKIMGGVVPYNKVWRTGANEATAFVTQADLELGGIEIPGGSYTLYTLPSETQWKLIINKQIGQWGTVYDAQQDLARINLEKKQLAHPVEKLTFSFDRGPNGSGALRIEWEYTSLSVPFKVSPIPIIASPRDSVELSLGGHMLSVNYGRPLARGRKIIGSLVPYNKVWRTGANEATTFVTDVDVVVGSVRIPRGTYSLYTLPSRGTWRLIINKETGQSGLVYHRKLDLARVKMQKRALKNFVERFSISLERTGERSGLLKLEWEKTSLSVPLKLAGK